MEKVNNFELIKPNIEDLWFKQEMLANPDTMSYNAGYEVAYSGYHYDTGCVDFPKENWKQYIDRIDEKDFFYYYILDKVTNEFVGTADFHRDENNEYMLGIVVHAKFRGRGIMRKALPLLIDKARLAGVKKLVDTVSEDREAALRVFYDFGFKKVDEFTIQRFRQPCTVAKIELDLQKS